MASKGAVKVLTRTVAVELGRHGIAVNAIAPGPIETAMTRKVKDDPDRLKGLLARVPVGRLGRPEDVANVAAFLASPEADFVTGSTYFVDGGQTWFPQE